MQWQQGNAQGEGTVGLWHTPQCTHTHSDGSGGAEGRLIDKRSDRQPTHSINSSLGADDDDDDEEHDQVETALGRAGQVNSTKVKQQQGNKSIYYIGNQTFLYIFYVLYRVMHFANSFFFVFIGCSWPAAIKIDGSQTHSHTHYTWFMHRNTLATCCQHKMLLHWLKRCCRRQTWLLLMLVLLLLVPNLDKMKHWPYGKIFFQRDCQMLISWKSGARLKRSASAIWNWLGQRKKMQEKRGEAAAQLSQTEIVLWQWLEDKRKAIASLRIRPTTHNFPTLVWAHRSWRMICGALSRKKSERQAGKGRAINATAEIWCWNSNWSSFILSHLRAEQFEPLLLLLPDAYRAH